jgi:hypothetical protein
MKTVLSFQNAKSNGRDILVINGVVSEYRGSEEQKEAQRFTMPIDGMKPQKFLAWWFRRKGASSSFRLYYNKSKGILLVSNLLTKDEANRKMVYTFYCDDTNKPLYVRKLMEDYCSIAGVKPNPKDSNAIEKTLRFHNNKKKYQTIGLATILIIIILLFMVM